MNQTIEVSIVDVLNRLEGKIDKLDSKIDKLDDKIDQVEERLEAKINQVEERFEKKFDTLSVDITDIKISLGKLGEKTTGLDTRLAILEFIYRGVGIAITGGILVAIFKFLFPIFNIG